MSSDDNKTNAYQNWLQKKPVVGRKKLFMMIFNNVCHM